MLRSSLRDYSYTYILVKGTIIVLNIGATAASNCRNKNVIFKNCAPFVDCINELNNKEKGAEGIHVIMPMYNLIEYSDNYSKTFWKFMTVI